MSKVSGLYLLIKFFARLYWLIRARLWGEVGLSVMAVLNDIHADGQSEPDTMPVDGAERLARCVTIGSPQPYAQPSASQPGITVPWAPAVDKPNKHGVF